MGVQKSAVLRVVDSGAMEGRIDRQDRVIVNDGKGSRSVSVRRFLSDSSFDGLGSPSSRLRMLQKARGGSSETSPACRMGSGFMRNNRITYANRILQRDVHFQERRKIFPGNSPVSNSLVASNLSKSEAGVRLEIPQRSQASANLGEAVRNWCQRNGWTHEQFYQFQSAMGNDPTVIRNAVEGRPNWVLPEDTRPIVVHMPSSAATRVVVSQQAAMRQELNESPLGRFL